MINTTTNAKKTFRIAVIPVVISIAAILLTGCPANPFYGLQPSPRDEEGPEVTIINPTDGQTVSGSLIVTGLSQDKYLVASVSLSVDDGTAILLEGTYNWFHVLDTSALEEGAHSLTVIAEDQFGNTSLTTVDFIVDQTVPTVNPLGFEDGFADFENYIRGTGTVLEVLARDDNGIDRVLISFDGGLSFKNLEYDRTSGDDEIWTYTIADTSTLIPGDGWRSVALRAYDRTGVLFGSSNYTLWIDNTPPLLSIDYPIDRTTLDASADLSANIFPVNGLVNDQLVAGLRRVTVDIGTLYSLSSDDDEVSFVDDDPNQSVYGTFESRQVLTALQVDWGPIVISVTAEDKAGNTTTVEVNIALDDNPPSFSGDLSTSRGILDDDAASQANNFGTGTFTIEGVVAVSGVADTMPGSIAGVTVALTPQGGGTPVYSGPVDTPPIDASGAFSHDLNTTGVPDGIYVLDLRVTNVRGGFQDVSRTIRIDNTGPAAAITAPAFPYSVTGNAVAISGSAAANVSAIESIEITVDDPLVTEITPDGGLFTAPDFTGIIFSNGYFSYTWDTVVNYTLNDQPVITVTVTDLAGNTVVDSITATIDPDSPTIRFDTYDHPTNTDYAGQPLLSGRFVNGGGILYGTATDNEEVSTIEISIDGGPFTDVGEPAAGGMTSVPWDYTLPGLSEGTHTLVVRVTDNGSKTNTSSIEIRVDNTAPTLTNLDAEVTDGSGTSYLHGLAEVSGTAADGGAGVESIVFTVDDPSDAQGPESLTWDGYDTFSVDWDTEVLPTDGANPVVAAQDIALSVVVTDAAGNRVTGSLTRDLGPYITALGKNYAYLGETGLIIAGENFTNGTADPVVTVGGGEINYDLADGVGGVTAAGIDSITFEIDSDYDNIDREGETLSSGPVIVTFNGMDNAEQAVLDPDRIKLDLFAVRSIRNAVNYYPDAVYNPDIDAVVAVYGSQAANNRYAYYTNGDQNRLVAPAESGGGFKYLNIAYYSPTTTTYVSHVYNSLRVSWSTDEFLFDEQTYTVPGTSATYNDIAVDSNGVLHLVYYDSGALYYRNSSDGFAAVTQIDGASSDAGAWVALTVDGSDNLHAAYFDATLNGLKYCFSSGGSWSAPRVVDSVTSGNFGNGIAVGSDGRVHISYYNNNSGDLRYARANGPVSTFTRETVDSNGLTGWFSSIALNTAGEAQITYANFSTLKPKYARQVSDGSGGYYFEAVTIGEASDYAINGNSNSTATVMVGSEVHMIYSNTDNQLRDAIYLPED